MAPILFFLFLSATLGAAAQQRHNISSGSSLTPTKNPSWLSPSGLYAFGFYRQASGYAIGIFLAGIPQKTVVWTANRDNPPVSGDVILNFTTDGRLILGSGRGQDTNVVDSEPAEAAAMLDTGNFVLYNQAQQIIWQSFDHPTNTLLQGQQLKAGSQLFSSKSEADQSMGIFRLNMQQDGNLVQYPVDTPDTAPYSYWSSGTDGKGDRVTLNLDDDGRFYLLNSTGFNIKTINEGGGRNGNGTIYLMKLDADGIFRVYSIEVNQHGNQSDVWASTDNKCNPKGLCGPNGFCVTQDQDADCRCLPGFARVEEGNWASGCERNFSTQSCKNSDENIIRYTIQGVPNTVWEDVSYSVLSLSTKEDCETACLLDCICEAAMYNDGNCKKLRLPLRFGRRNLDSSNVALIKVGLGPSMSRPPPVVVPPEKKEELGRKILIVSVSLIAFAFAVLAIAGVLIHKSHVWAYKRVLANGNFGLIEAIALRSFTYAELVEVTNNFEEEIGQGAFGTVYKGTLPDSHQVVAVKKLDRVSTEGEREFQTEMKTIGRTHHRNLVKLLGHCLDGPNRLLVYEFMRNGSLADILFTTEKENQPCWDERMEIGRDIARGLLYLHEDCETQIIHCDIKPQNILIDEYRCAKISDFGLAKLLKPDQTRTFTGIRGTKGYVAPEWHRKLPVTVKADVYSFGIVLLELICRRRSVDWSLPEEEAILEELVYHCFETGELVKMVGTDERVNKKQLERVVKVALWCILDEPSLRPSMKKVLLMLEGTVDIPTPPNPTSFLSTI